MPETASAGGGYLYGGDAGTSEAYGSTVPLTSVPLVVEWPYSGSPCVLYVELRAHSARAPDVGLSAHVAPTPAARLAAAAPSDIGVDPA